MRISDCSSDVCSSDLFSELLFIKTILIGVICGMVARIFVDLTHGATRLFLRVRTRFGLWPPLMPVLGGCLLAVLIFVIPTKYLGLSLPLMNQALAGYSMPYLGFLSLVQASCRERVCQ